MSQKQELDKEQANDDAYNEDASSGEDSEPVAKKPKMESFLDENETAEYTDIKRKHPGNKYYLYIITILMKLCHNGLF